MNASQRINWIVGILGWWEITAPFVLKYTTSGNAFWNEIIVGFLLIILGVWGGVAQDLTLERVIDAVILIIGVWLIISPFILNYSGTESPTAMWYPIVVGAIIVILEIIAFVTARTPTKLIETQGK